MRILKFGGKSLENLEKTQKICKYIKKIYKSNKKLIIVVSAMGSTTNNLIDMVKPFNPETASPRELDTLLSTGETTSASIFAIILNSIGVPAKSFQGWQIKIKTHGDYQNSLITSIDKSVLDKELNQNIVCVIAGFQGINHKAEITTLGRGGSDTTACALGAVYNTNVELYSDFNGIFHADPRDIQTKKLNSISLANLDQITQAGSRIVSNRAVKIAKTNNLSLILKSSSKPSLKGSLSSAIEKESLFISTNSNLCEINIVFSNELKIKLLSKNVLIWLNAYKIYNFNINFQKITLLINQSDKMNVLKILSENLNIF